MECLEKIRSTALIDWFRFTCFFELDPLFPSEMARQLFDLLKVNPDYFTCDKNYLYNLKYNKTVVYDADVKVGLDVKNEARVEGVAGQFIVDLSGSACRSFESRGGSWKELITFLVGHKCRFNRIDLAMDDIDGVLDLNYIKRKINEQSFSSCFRGRKENGRIGNETYLTGWYEPDDLDDKGMKLLDTSKGYTCSFGSRQSSTFLNIYDKLSERESKGMIPGVHSWIRFEVSFIRGKCDYAVRNIILPSIENETFGKTVAGIMRGLIEFKEAPRDSKGDVRALLNTHINRLRIDRRYCSFLHNAAKIKVPSNQAKVEQSVTRTVNWAKGYWLSSLATLFASPRYAMNEILNALFEKIDEQEILTWQFVSKVRAYTRSLGAELSVDEILDNLQSYIDTFGGNVDVRKVFDERLARDRAKMKPYEKFLSDLELDDLEPKVVITPSGEVLPDLELGDDIC